MRFTIFLCLSLLISSTAAFRVLGLFTMSSISHNSFFKVLMEDLADRGHQVTMVSPFPLRTAKHNYTDVDISSVVEHFTNAFSYETLALDRETIPRIVRLLARYMGNDHCRDVFGSQQFQDIMQGKHGEFDVVFTEIFITDCFAVVAHLMKVPLISMVSSPDSPGMHARMGSIDNPSYIGSVLAGYLGKMTFLQRLYNVYSYIVTDYMYKQVMQVEADEVVREFFGPDIPPLSEIVRNTSLVLVNRHVSIFEARPVTPNVVHVGGMHYRPTVNGLLDPGLKRWLDEAEHGVILFSLGSMVLSSTLPPGARAALLAAFARVPQRVVWKYEEELPGLPPNVRIASWLPQQEILAHPNTVLFITHGGLMGTTEALIAGVPILGIPLFMDQITNVRLFERHGIGEHIDHLHLTEEYILTAITKMTRDKRYLLRAREVSSLTRDRPMTPAKEAVWWVEYVMRHGGAPHLQPLGADMPLHQYLLLDVVAAVLAAVLSAAALVVMATRAALRAVAASSRAKRKAE